ncbi:MAG: SulP family inorganic anion transporter [Gammaproteobacteria bacterium]|nr:SulP family inorganic anion transporter [Gammaproteobacteria bacterium]
MSAFREMVSELRSDIRSTKMVPALSAGFTSGLALLVAQVAFGSFIFSGALAPYSSQGIGLILFGNFAACLLMALVGGYRGAIAGLSPALVIVMATIATTMDLHGKALFVTVASALMISAVTTGVCCLVIGRFRLTNLVRFIPYPVAAGFVSGIGGMVCLAAMSLMGADPGSQATLTLLEPSVLWAWAPGVVYGAALYLLVRRGSSALILPASVVVAVGAYHLALGALGISGDEARALGLLLASTADEALWPALFPADLVQVEWAAMAGQLPNLLTLVLVAFICIILNLAGLELAVNRDLEWNHEFRATGFASIVAGLGGGTVATLIVPSSLRSSLFKANTRLTGVVAAIVIGAALLLGDGMLEFVPTALIGGILVMAGLGMLDEGLVKSRNRLPRVERGIILAIFVVIVGFGLLEGVAVGMLASLVFFAVRLSRVDPVESRFTARERHSNKARSVPDRMILLEEGGRVQVYQLCGYIFFGSVGSLTDPLRKALEGPSRPACLMLDFTAVSGFDFSAVSALARVLQTANEAGVKVVLSAVSEPFRSGLELNLPASVYAELVLEPDTDRALEHCEEIVIEAWRTDDAVADHRRTALLAQTGDLERHLERLIRFEDLVEELQAWLTPRDYATGEVLTDDNTLPAGLQLLVSGRASAYDGADARLNQFSPGDAVWPVTGSDAQGARVSADEACRTMILTPAARHWIEKHEGKLALKLYRYLLAGHFQDRPSPGREDGT